MPGMPELPVPNTSREQAQVDGTIDTKAIYQTHRGKVPEGHEDKRPTIKTATGAVEYEPEG